MLLIDTSFYIFMFTFTLIFLHIRTFSSKLWKREHAQNYDLSLSTGSQTHVAGLQPLGTVGLLWASESIYLTSAPSNSMQSTEEA